MTKQKVLNMRNAKNLRTRIFGAAVLAASFGWASAWGAATDGAGSTQGVPSTESVASTPATPRQEKGEYALVYPATSSTSASARSARGATRPVAESGSVYDVETPLGQVRLIVDTLEELRDGQRETTERLAGFTDRLNAGWRERTDELATSIEALGERVSGMERQIEELARLGARRDEAESSRVPGPAPSGASSRVVAVERERDRGSSVWRSIALAAIAVIVTELIRRLAASCSAARRD